MLAAVIIGALSCLLIGGCSDPSDGARGTDTDDADIAETESTASTDTAATDTGGTDIDGTDIDNSESDAVDANATVERVVDGDTLVADVGGVRERVRLIGIDTPESVKKGSPVECFGKEASARMSELLPAGTAIRIELDVEERDRYDRLLAYVYRASDGVFINLTLAADGYAGLLTYPPNVAHTDEFRVAVSTARSEGRGLWASCGDDPPVDAP